jgi:arylsulfatase A-like enzyme
MYRLILTLAACLAVSLPNCYETVTLAEQPLVTCGCSGADSSDTGCTNGSGGTEDGPTDSAPDASEDEPDTEPLDAAPEGESGTGAPNVVMFVADDFGANAFAIGVELGLFPNIKTHLIDAGTWFVNALSTNPWCCPARASIMSGRYSWNVGIYHNRDEYASWLAWEQANVSLSEQLFQAGYHMGWYGKWLNAYSSFVHPPPRGHHVWQGLMNASSAYDMYGYPLRICDKMTSTGVYCVGSGGSQGYSTSSPGTHMAAEFSSRVSTYIASAPEPFAVQVYPTMPHVEHGQGGSYTNRHSVRQFRTRPLPEHYCALRQKTETGECIEHLPFGGLGGDLDLPACRGTPTGAFDEENINDKPPWLRLGANSGDGPAPRIGGGCQSTTLGTLNNSTGSDMRRIHSSVMEQMMSFDWMFGQVRNAVAARGLLANTIFVFFVDNGLLNGEHRLALKMAPYRESVEIPVVMAGPGILPGQVRTEAVTLADIYPTLVELTGGASFDCDGRSLAPLLRGETLPWRKFVVLSHWYAGKNNARQSPLDAWDMNDYVAIRTMANHAYPNRLYVEYLSTNNVPPWAGGSVVGREYYLHNEDPYELDSQHQNPTYLAEQAELSAIANAYKSCSGSACRAMEEQ